ncbi:copper homeostasis protein [Frigoribacterium sp. PhB160]|uniref:copper homeostasis protein CutC n=1 Tax=Frigoribacterium sp. PhB160 TaxID=2485192 RepID=UPI000F46E1AC|nr:copper homeostasis protein CutC [Frigoribacterium sp. PhB160]ROS59102.1 copper homeostasis protein [Frigoribacterium sp. PhB160]
MTDPARASSTDAPATTARVGAAVGAGAPSRPRPALEVAVTSLAGARVALEGGADRVELCSALELGGVTPSQGLADLVVGAGLPVHALVRCRAGGFDFDADELAVMLREVRALVATGVAGVVVGALRPEGSLDEEALARLRDAAGPSVEVTVHRAVDRSADPVASVARLAALGVHRVLTSGGASRVADGLAAGTIAAMVRAAGPVQVMAGGGVRVDDVPGLASAGVAAVHLSASRLVGPGHDGGPAEARRPVSLGSAASDSHPVTDLAGVRAARRALDALG